MARSEMYVDNFTGLTNHTPVHTFNSQDNVDAIRIYHRMNIVRELVDEIEMCKIDPHHASLPIRKTLSDAVVSGGLCELFKVLHDENHRAKSKNLKRKLSETDVSSQWKFPDHEVVCNNINKMQRTHSATATKPPVAHVKQLSKETSYNIFNKRKAYSTPRGVYDRTTCRELIH
jgi:hypothetical protein